MFSDAVYAPTIVVYNAECLVELKLKKNKQELILYDWVLIYLLSLTGWVIICSYFPYTRLCMELGTL